MRRIVLGILSLLMTTTVFAQNLDQISLKKGIKTNGSLNFSNMFYASNDTLSLREPYAYYLNGSLNINAFGIAMPFSFSVSNTAKSYTQPFNRFQIAPKYKWAKLYVGNASMNFSEYTLAGHQFNGVGMELSPGNWIISGMYGNLLNAVEYDSISNNLSSVGYKRKAAALKLGYAKNGDNISVDVLSAKDITSSILYPIPAEANIHPMSNNAINFSAKKTLFKKLYVETQYAISFMNGDTRLADGGISTDSVQSSNFIDKILNINTADRYYDAFSAAFGYQSKSWGLALNYQRVAPEYKSLGAYYFNNDMENYTIAPYLKLFKGKINIAGNIGLQYNDLNDMQAQKTRRFVGSGNIAYASGKKWNASFNYSNFTNYTNVKPTGYPYYVDNLDSLNFYQVNTSYASMLSYNFGTKEIRNSIMLNATYQNADGSNSGVASDFINGQLAYNRQWTEKNTSASLAMTANYGDISLAETFLWGPRLMASKSFYKKKLNTSLACSYNQNRLNNVLNGSLLNSTFSAVYNIKPKNKKLGQHNFSLNANLTNRLKCNTDEYNKYDLIITVAYNTSF